VQLGPLVRKETKATPEIPETLVIRVPQEGLEIPATLVKLVRKEIRATKATLGIPATQEGLEIPAILEQLATEAQVLL
jgi:hypothetical protein